MTFYAQQVAAISRKLYANIYLTQRVIQSKYFIDQHFADKLTLAEICRASAISKRHLIRSFLKCYGRTPIQYLTAVRIARAKQLLKEGATVSEACYAVGFESATTFAGLFKKCVGVSPKRF